MVVSFTVYGHPEPGGSKRGFPSKDGRHVILTDANPRAASWKRAVAEAAYRAMQDAGLKPFESEAVEVKMTFTVLRPRSHYGTGKNSGVVRPGAPRFPTTKPDVLKLARPIEDAMTGIVYRDDCQTVKLIATKVYGEPESVTIVVSAL